MNEFNGQIEYGNNGKREINNSVKNLEKLWDDFNKKELPDYIRKALSNASTLIEHLGNLFEKKESTLIKDKNIEDILIDLKKSIDSINLLKEKCSDFKTNFKDTKDENFNDINRNKLKKIIDEEENTLKILNDFVDYINLRKNEIK